MHVKYCCVSGCETKQGNGLSLFGCPTDEAIFKIWKNQLGITDVHKYANITPQQAKHQIKVCSLHFEDCWFRSMARQRLKTGAVPTLLLPTVDSLIVFKSDIYDEDMDLDNKTVEIKDDIEKYEGIDETPCVKLEKVDPNEEIYNRSEDEHSTENWGEFNCTADPIEHVKIEDQAAVQIKSEKIEPDLYDVDEEFENGCSSKMPLELNFKTECKLELDSVMKKENFENDLQAIQSEIKRELFICYMCNYTDQCKEGLVNHMNLENHQMKTSSEESQITHITPYPCSHCNAVYTNKPLLDEHMVRKHPNIGASVSTKTHQCTNCEYKTIYKSHLKRHMSIHTRTVSKIIACKHCDAQFINKQSLDDHIIKKHPDFIESVSCKILECTICEYKTTKKSSLDRHNLAHTSGITKLSFCKHCNVSFKCNRSLDVHIVKTHPDFIESVSCKVYECPNCEYKTIYKTSIRHHMSIHPGVVFKCYMCEYCNAQFKKKPSLDDHIVKNHPKFIAKVNSKIHECKTCDFKTVKKSSLDNHLRTHLRTISKVNMCEFCNKTFNRKQSLDIHISKNHPESVTLVSCEIFECFHCGYRTTNRQGFTYHVMKHTEQSGSYKIHKCTKCDYKTTRKSRFNNHISIHADDDGVSKLDMCEYCDVIFENKNALDEHIVQQHPNFITSIFRKIHQCTKCDFKTTEESSLSSHMLTHTGAASKAKICEHCLRIFKRKKSLDNHIIKVHPDCTASVTHKVYECMHCGYKSTNRRGFTEHVVKHSIKPSPCIHCNASFKSKQTLGNHIIKKHPKFISSIDCKLQECIYCEYKTTRRKHLVNHMMLKHPKHTQSVPSDIQGSKSSFDNRMLIQAAEADICEYCNAIFENKQSLDNHITTNHPNLITTHFRHQCTKCDFKTTEESTLASHMVVHSSAVSKVEMCEYCNKTFKKRVSLNDHMLKNHPNSTMPLSHKIHECTKCDYKTTYKASFTSHMFTHRDSGAKFEICKYCNATFKRKLSLEDHIVKHHPNFIDSITSKILKCTRCDFKTRKKCSLDSHMLIHPGAGGVPKFVMCEYCDRTFKRKTLLDDHILKQHPTCIASVSSKIHECTFCDYKTTFSHVIYSHMKKHPEHSPGKIGITL